MRSRKSLPEQARLDWYAPGLVAGVDEAGRGPLAGPVVAAAVILDELKPIAGLADSKTLTAARRERLYDEIRAKALCCSIAEASVEEIDRINILQATMLAMRRAVLGLRLKPARVLVDGNRLPALDVPAEAIVKGDATVAGDRGRPSNYLYGSAKSAVTAFCGGLRARLFKAGVNLTTIKPGFVDTPMTKGLPLPAPLVATPEQVAADIAKAMDAGKGVLYTRWFWRYIMLIIIHIPDRIFRKMSM